MIIKSVSDFIERVLQLWPPYRWDEVQEKAWSEIMVRELGGFKPEVLDRAFQDLVRNHEKGTPSVKICINACVEARRWVEAQENHGKLPAFQKTDDEWSTERWRLAHELKQSALGRQAAREGWIVSFVHFCRKNQRHPAGPEIEQCKRDSSGIEEIYAKALRGDMGPKDAPVPVKAALSGAIAKWALDILDKRKKWAEEALGR